MASVVEGVGKGAAAGSVAGPLGGAIGGLLGAGSTLFSNHAEREAAEKAKKAYSEQAYKGIEQLKEGRQQNTDAQNPYIAAGHTGVGSALASTQGRTQAEQPIVSNSSPQKALEDYLNPSAAYTTRIANDAITAKALASGGAGGGMLKALSDNSNKMAMVNYNNAYEQMLKTGDQNFTQGQQIYKNNTDFDQSQIGNYLDIGKVGEAAAANLGTTNLGYDTDINSSYKDIGNSNAGGDYLKGLSNSAATQQTGNLLASSLQNYMSEWE